jgi:hypothetical protein
MSSPRCVVPGCNPSVQLLRFNRDSHLRAPGAAGSPVSVKETVALSGFQFVFHPWLDRPIRDDTEDMFAVRQ